MKRCQDSNASDDPLESKAQIEAKDSHPSRKKSQQREALAITPTLNRHAKTKQITQLAPKREIKAKKPAETNNSFRSTPLQ
jgi:hypothetical protein